MYRSIISHIFEYLSTDFLVGLTRLKQLGAKTRFKLEAKVI